ncbi:hypothetical protein J4H86_08865 [Spiractinospora alimapuensis]|uniref:hypothetical protein n=1 Tax=Spiractinospora alimapuensis TaxID=2820884 RepID=UPI001F173420|nr:hypothetical protein [Spiractinospora alimapuensis]QVQ53806.1 hypothetical protein J4H86_08865 [Spiractinospora alimapuensis]
MTFLVAIVGVYLAPMFRVTFDFSRPGVSGEGGSTVMRMADQLPLMWAEFVSPRWSPDSEVYETPQWLAVIILGLLIAGGVNAVRGGWRPAFILAGVAALLVGYNLFTVPLILHRGFDSGFSAISGRSTLTTDPHPVGMTVIVLSLLLPLAVTAAGWAAGRRCPIPDTGTEVAEPR